nr:four helix bundle protein [uncultured Ruminococcus sp.]
MKGELATYSIEFSLRIVSFYKWLTEVKHEYVMARQILRSGKSIGANIHEAEYAISKAGFINKIQIAAKEANEIEYWLIILERSGFFDKSFEDLKPLLKSLIRMLTATLKTSKNGK